MLCILCSSEDQTRLKSSESLSCPKKAAVYVLGSSLGFKRSQKASRPHETDQTKALMTSAEIRSCFRSSESWVFIIWSVCKLSVRHSDGSWLNLRPVGSKTVFLKAMMSQNRRHTVIGRVEVLWAECGWSQASDWPGEATWCLTRHLIGWGESRLHWLCCFDSNPWFPAGSASYGPL